MSFDYFNTSYLAFGKNLSNVFRSLYKRLNGIEDNLIEIVNYFEKYKDIKDNNYIVDTPESEDKAVNCKFIYDCLNIEPWKIKNISVNNQILTVQVNILNNYKIGICSGSTEITDGICYIDTLPTSNKTLGIEIKFIASDNEDIDTTLRNKVILFEYIFDENNQLSLRNVDGRFPIEISNWDKHYNNYNLELKNSLLNHPTPRDMVLLVVTNKQSGVANVYLNGVNYYSKPDNIGVANSTCVPIYCKKGDVVTGDIANLYQVNYISGDTE